MEHFITISRKAIPSYYTQILKIFNKFVYMHMFFGNIESILYLSCLFQTDFGAPRSWVHIIRLLLPATL